jgi:hypothetical protein
MRKYGTTDRDRRDCNIGNASQNDVTIRCGAQLSTHIVPGSRLRRVGERREIRALPFLDRRGRLLGRCWRQHGWGAGLPRVGIRAGRLWRNAGRPRTGRRRLGRRRWFCFRSRRRLQRRRGLRHLFRTTHSDLSQRESRYDKPDRNQRGGEQQLLLVGALPDVRDHIVHREFVRDINGRRFEWFQFRRADFAERFPF